LINWFGRFHDEHGRLYACGINVGHMVDKFRFALLKDPIDIKVAIELADQWKNAVHAAVFSAKDRALAAATRPAAAAAPVGVASAAASLPSPQEDGARLHDPAEASAEPAHRQDHLRMAQSMAQYFRARDIANQLKHLNNRNPNASVVRLAFDGDKINFAVSDGNAQPASTPASNAGQKRLKNWFSPLYATQDGQYAAAGADVDRHIAKASSHAARTVLLRAPGSANSPNR
jgi:hypothetical protein